MRKKPISQREPAWPEIMRVVWKAQLKDGKKRPNPVLEERTRRDVAIGLNKITTRPKRR